jgi:hypothetical protein
VEVLKFSHQACHYILAYFYIEHEQEQKINQEELNELNIKKVKKSAKQIEV